MKKIWIGPKQRALSIVRIEGIAAELRLIDRTVNEIAEQAAESRQELILRKYIELQRTDEVAAWLKQSGCRMGEGDGGRQYLHTHVTDEIISKEKDVCTKLRTLAKAIYDYNKGNAGWTALVRAFRNYE